MNRNPVTRAAGIRTVRQLKQRLREAGVPFEAVYLYGSVARDQAHAWSDIDVAIIGPRFKDTRHEENMICRRLRWDLDVRIEPICLHPEDFVGKFFPLAQEVERTGVEI